MRNQSLIYLFGKTLAKRIRFQDNQWFRIFPEQNRKCLFLTLKNNISWLLLQFSIIPLQCSLTNTAEPISARKTFIVWKLIAVIFLPLYNCVSVSCSSFCWAIFMIEQMCLPNRFSEWQDDDWFFAQVA